MNAKTSKSFVLLAALLMVLLLPASLLLAGCTSYQITRGTEACPECTTVKVLSWRNFEQPAVHYERGADSASFDFGAQSAMRAASPLEAVGAVTLQRVLDTYLPPARPAGAPAPIPAAPSPEGG